jgi:hypothetical protein
VLSGTVAFEGEGGRVASSNIQTDGSYSIPDAPIGKAKITVQTFPRSPHVVPPEKIDSTPVEIHKYSRIPDHYAELESSASSYDVKPDKQTHDIELK